MNDEPRQRFRAIVTRYGQQGYLDPQRCANLLQDLNRTAPDQMQALLGALRERVPADLLKWSSEFPHDILAAGLAQRLRGSELALTEELAAWAVESWHQVLRINLYGDPPPEQTPHPRLLSAAGLDLVLVLDLICDDLLLNERRAFFQRIVTAIQKGLAPKVPLRIGWLAYGDYNHLASVRGQGAAVNPLFAHNLGDASSALQTFQELSPTSGSDFEAALEDALAALLDLSWQAAHRRVAVVVGGRPPHPVKPEPGRRQIGSPSRLDWREQLGKNRDALGLCSLGVQCPIFWPGTSPLPDHAAAYAQSCWQEIGYTALFDYETTTPEAVAEAILTAPPRP